MTGAKGESKRTAAVEDAIWRQSVKNELKAAREWDSMWGYIKEIMEEEKKARPQKDMPSRYERLPPIKPQTSPSPYASGLPSKLSERLSTSRPEDDEMMSNWFVSHHVDRIVKSRYPVDKYMVPPTTSSEVGWVWGMAREEPVAIEITSQKPKFKSLEKYEMGASVDTILARKWEQFQKKLIREWKDEKPAF
ncbi:hypothetical protein HDU96_003145 [Phlyctochytrium bullatum]|nr:hypothetical protein HDU96_003145 [Phlyctochytrium bullatum]